MLIIDVDCCVMLLVVFLDGQGTGGGPKNVQGCGKWELMLSLVFAASCQLVIALPIGLDLMIQMVNGGGTPIVLDRD